MIKEFAVDPEAVTTWENFRYVTEKMGVENGRVMSEYPGRWVRHLIDLINCDSELKPVRKASMIARLSRLKRTRAICSFARLWDDTLGWTENAVCEHKRVPFHRIIVKAPSCTSTEPVAIDDVEEDHFSVQRELAVPRSANALANALKPLLAVSREVVLVDPYFRPDALRWRTPLGEILCAAVSNGVALRRCEFHLVRRDDLLEDFEYFKNECERKLPDVIPKDVELKLIRWQQSRHGGGDPGEHFHARYVLTDIGGVHVDSGLDEGEGAETTDVRLLSRELWQKRREDLLGDPPAFAPADVDTSGRHRVVSVTGTRIAGGISPP